MLSKGIVAFLEAYWASRIARDDACALATRKDGVQLEFWREYVKICMQDAIKWSDIPVCLVAEQADTIMNSITCAVMFIPSNRFVVDEDDVTEEDALVRSDIVVHSYSILGSVSPVVVCNDGKVTCVVCSTNALKAIAHWCLSD